jgi:hypothetical protein
MRQRRPAIAGRREFDGPEVESAQRRSRGIEFAKDSLAEEDGFEPSVPLTKYVGPSQKIRRFLSRRGDVPLGGMADEYAQVQRHL